MIFKFKDCDREIAAVDLEGVSGTVMDIQYNVIEVITYNTPNSIKVHFENVQDMYKEFIRLCFELEVYKEKLEGKEAMLFASIASGTQH